jgi:hypothetical protein
VRAWGGTEASGGSHARSRVSQVRATFSNRGHLLPWKRWRRRERNDLNAEERAPRSHERLAMYGEWPSFSQVF